MAVINRISTPKTSGCSRSTGRSRFYDYYAGYSDSFAHDVIRSLDLCPDSTVLDPWNGSGTTTYAAGCLGLKAVGLDVNPSMTLVAKARMCGTHSSDGWIRFLIYLLMALSYVYGNNPQQMILLHSGLITKQPLDLERFKVGLV